MQDPIHDAHRKPDDDRSTTGRAAIVATHSRRAVLGSLATVATATLAGCQGGTDSGSEATPVAVGEDQCDSCGMVIGDQFGPSGQVFYAEHSPEGHPNPARFDALASCLFPYHFGKRARGWQATGTFVTDYSSVDYHLRDRKGNTYISGHTGAGTYARAETVTLVVGSEVHGAMGADAIPFSDRDDAAAFRDVWGGNLLAIDEVEPGTFGRA